MGHLTIEERCMIYSGIAHGLSRKQIAQNINRDPSTVTRELKRNKDRSRCYSVFRAQTLATQRRKTRPLTRKLEEPKLLAKVVEKLELNWSPEQIADRLRVESGDRMVSHETIYAFLRALPRSHPLVKAMRRGGRKYRRRKHGIASKIPSRVSIHDRSKVVDERGRYGDWELDLIVGTEQSGFLITAVDRRSGFLKMLKVTNKRTKTVMSGIVRLFADEDSSLLKTFTFDNGTEFTGHKILQEKLGVKTYFADPFCSGQRGTNENTNGLVRQYMPKRLNFGCVSVRDVRNALRRINNRPRKRLRKRLRYLTPNEVLYESRKIAFQF